MLSQNSFDFLTPSVDFIYDGISEFAITFELLCALEFTRMRDELIDNKVHIYGQNYQATESSSLLENLKALIHDLASFNYSKIPNFTEASISKRRFGIFVNTQLRQLHALQSTNLIIRAP